MLSDYVAPISTITASELFEYLEREKQEKAIQEKEGSDNGTSD